MISIRGVLVALVLMICSHSALALDSATICSGQPVPANWLVIRVFNSPGTCGDKYAMKITNTSGKRVVTVCSNQTLPPGFLVTGTGNAGVVCRTSGYRGPNVVWEVTRTANMAMLDICPGQKIPVGWLKTGEKRNVAKCVWGDLFVGPLIPHIVNAN